MILSFPVIPKTQKILRIQEQIEGLTWRDVLPTAGDVAQNLKRNEQAVMSDSAGQALWSRILSFIIQKAIHSAGRPRRFLSLLLSRTGEGGCNGQHIDNAIMREAEAWMCGDNAFTLFLSSPDTYDGGELVIQESRITCSRKAPVGHLVFFPSLNIYGVKREGSGERVVCVGWIKSMIADPVERELLFEMEQLRQSLRQNLSEPSAELLPPDKMIANLLRKWARP